MEVKELVKKGMRVDPEATTDDANAKKTKTCCGLGGKGKVGKVKETPMEEKRRRNSIKQSGTIISQRKQA